VIVDHRQSRAGLGPVLRTLDSSSTPCSRKWFIISMLQFWKWR